VESLHCGPLVQVLAELGQALDAIARCEAVQFLAIAYHAGGPQDVSAEGLSYGCMRLSLMIANSGRRAFGSVQHFSGTIEMV
jgi:hypothetical protein